MKYALSVPADIGNRKSDIPKDPNIRHRRTVQLRLREPACYNPYGNRTNALILYSHALYTRLSTTIRNESW